MLTRIIFILLLMQLPLFSQELQWKRLLSSPDEIYVGRTLVPCTDGGILILGSFGSGGYSGHITKVSALGGLDWRLFYGQENDPVFIGSSLETSPGNYTTLSYTQAWPGAFAPVKPHIQVLNTNGELVSSGSSSSEIFWYRPYGIIQDGSISIVSTQYSQDTNFVTFTKLSYDGELLYKNISRIDSSGIYSISKVVPNEDGFLIGGSVYKKNDTRTRLFLLRLNQMGEIVWSWFSEMEPGRSQSLEDIAISPEGIFLLALTTDSNKPGIQTSVLTLGSTNTTMELPFGLHSLGVSILLPKHPHEKILVFGSSNSTDNPEFERAAVVSLRTTDRSIKVDTTLFPYGTRLLWSCRNRDGLAVVCGLQGSDMLIAAFAESEVSGVKTLSSPPPIQFNAIGDWLIVRGLIPGTYTLSLYDCSGKCVLTSKTTIHSSLEEIKIDISSLPRGVYYYNGGVVFHE